MEGMNQSETLVARFASAQKKAVIVGGVGMAILIAGAFVDVGEFFQAYLFGLLFWVAITIGSIGWKLLHNLVSGAWGFVIRRLLEAAIRPVPMLAVLAVLFVPVFFGAQYIYVAWMHVGGGEVSHELAHKAGYLNLPFFIVRTLIYIGIWAFFAWKTTSLTAKQENTPPPAPPLIRTIQRISGLGLVVLVLTATLASVDWVMSLTPEWTSTIYGLIYIVGGALGAICLMTALVVSFADEKPLSDVMHPSIYHDLGNLMFALTMLWAYVSFSQLLIVWMGNISEEAHWYTTRMGPSGWGVIGWVLIVVHFSAPFLLLLQRRNKRNPRRLRSIAIFLLVMRIVDMYWTIWPSFGEGKFYLSWMALASVIGFGGLWMAILIMGLKGKPLMPLYDPRMQVALDRAAHASEAAAQAGHRGTHIQAEGGV